MNWALGLRECGCDVFLVEDLRPDELEVPESDGERSPQEEFFEATMREFGFDQRHCLLVDGRGPDSESLSDFAADTDLFLNYSGQFKRLDLVGERSIKCYLDVDPAFTQLWAEVCRSDMNFAGHDRFFTVGTNLTGPGALVPLLGMEWMPVVPPVSARTWKGYADLPEAGSCWSTVCHWYGYNDLSWEGHTYGGKRTSLLELQSLPTLLNRPVRIATDLQPGWGDYEEFADAGWQIISSADVCRDVPTYLQFLSSSRGEVGIAKGGYVVSHGGWMSDRSVTYLGLGRPVALQDTGWTHAVPPTDALKPFRGVEEAAETILRIETEYEAACRTASGMGAGVFSPARALQPILDVK